MRTRKEPQNIVSAREHLAKFEKDMLSDQGLFHLSEGLGLLDDVCATANKVSDSDLAKNIGGTYILKTYDEIRRSIDNRIKSPEVTLEKYFALLAEIDNFDFGNEKEVSGLKVDVVKQLFDYYLEGYSEHEREKFINDFKAKYT